MDGGIGGRRFDVKLSLAPAVKWVESSPDLILFPELVPESEFELACSRYPDAVVVAATQDQQVVRGRIHHRGIEKISYLKIGTDGQTNGTAEQPRVTPVYQYESGIIAIIVCMDIQTSLLKRVVDKLLEMPAAPKVLCIPADMGAEWFTQETLDSNYHGVWVALCNRLRADKSTRCESFIANPKGKKVITAPAGKCINFAIPI